MRFFIDKNPKEYLLKFGYIPLFKDKWIKLFGSNTYPRYHIYSYGYDWQKGYELEMHIDDEKHVSKRNKTNRKLIAKEVALLVAENFHIDKVVEAHKNSRST